tara:strand:+ start:674 stop:1171 length:498 start_codon:yes stop_codon:yes gene_type:complete
MDILPIQNVFQPEHWDYIDNKLSQDNWGFGQTSIVGEGYPFWIMYLKDDPFFTEILPEVIWQECGKRFAVDDVYANGQTFGLGGDFHQDHSDYTFLIYANSEWDVLWGGRTLFKEGLEDNNPLAITPLPRSAVLFNSKIYHYAESPTRECTTLRKTIAYKLINED